MSMSKQWLENVSIKMGLDGEINEKVLKEGQRQIMSGKSKMYIYRIYQDVNSDYDTYDSAIVISDSPENAIKIHPDGIVDWDGKDPKSGSWCNIEYVKVEYIGQADSKWNKPKPGVILASFNAG